MPDTEESTHIHIPGVHVAEQTNGDSVLCISFLSILQLLDLKPRKKSKAYSLSSSGITFLLNNFFSKT